MAGLLGFMAAGAAKGYAEGRGKELQQEQEFNLRKALADYQADKEMQLKMAGYEMDDKREEAKKDKVAGIANSVVDPMKGKGGYEPEEVTEKRERGLLKLKADKLADAGEYDAAKVYYGRSDAADKTELQAAQLELKKDQLLATIKNWDDKLGLQGQIAEAKNATQLAKLEAVVAKNNAGRDYKPTESQSKKAQFMEAYADDPKYVKNGKLTGAGYDKLNKLADDSNFQDVTREPALDPVGRPIIGKDNKPVMTEKIKTRERKPTGVTTRTKDGNYTFTR